MTTYKLTTKAAEDLTEIYEYSIHNFGVHIAHDYMLGLDNCLCSLAQHPDWGNDYSSVAEKLHRYEYRSHSIYYISTSADLLIIRVLGKRQDPGRNL